MSRIHFKSKCSNCIVPTQNFALLIRTFSLFYLIGNRFWNVSSPVKFLTIATVSLCAGAVIQIVFYAVILRDDVQIRWHTRRREKIVNGSLKSKESRERFELGARGTGSERGIPSRLPRRSCARAVFRWPLVCSCALTPHCYRQRRFYLIPRTFNTW